MDQMHEEIKYDVRKDQLITFYKKNKKHISNAVFFVFLAIAGYFFYKSRQDEARLDASKSLYYAMHHSKPEAALKSLKHIAKKSGYSYADLTKFFAAQLFEQQGKYEEARQVLQTLIKDTAHQTFKDLARLKLVRLDIDNKQNLEEAATHLAPFNAETNPWHYQAQELHVALKIAEGKKSEAKKRAEDLINSDKAPADIKNRMIFIRPSL